MNNIYFVFLRLFKTRMSQHLIYKYTLIETSRYLYEAKNASFHVTLILSIITLIVFLPCAIIYEMMSQQN